MLNITLIQPYDKKRDDLQFDWSEAKFNGSYMTI